MNLSNSLDGLRTNRMSTNNLAIDTTGIVAAGAAVSIPFFDQEWALGVTGAEVAWVLGVVVTALVIWNRALEVKKSRLQIRLLEDKLKRKA